MPTGTKVNLDIIYSNGERENASFIVPNGEQGPVGPVGPAGQVQFARLGSRLLNLVGGTQYALPIYEYNENNIYTKIEDGDKFSILLDKPGFYDVELERGISVSHQINAGDSMILSSNLMLHPFDDEPSLNDYDASTAMINASTISTNSYHVGHFRHKMSVNVTDSGYYLYSIIQSFVYNDTGNISVIPINDNAALIQDRIFISHYPAPSN